MIGGTPTKVNYISQEALLLKLIIYITGGTLTKVNVNYIYIYRRRPLTKVNYIYISQTVGTHAKVNYIS